jgi:hypothetical protein
MENLILLSSKTACDSFTINTYTLQRDVGSRVPPHGITIELANCHYLII